MSEEAIETVPFLVTILEEDEEVKGLFSQDKEIVLQDIPVDTLKKNLGRVCRGITTALEEVKRVGSFKLKEVTVQVEVSAEGGVEFIGTANLGGTGAITLTFSE